LLDGLPAGDARRDDVEDIRQAADRAAALTRQLLAFSRKQVLAPVDLDLNELIAGVHKMLRRLISEDIALVIDTAPRVGLVHADRCQIEQVIMNLCVNARDAMPSGGTLRIATQDAVVPDSSGSPDETFVRLSIADTGTGMDDEVKQHMFEPFFTTKGPGKGTGLGLSTCYGIIKQSGGFIEVDSTLGRGTTFHVYLPSVTPSAGSKRPSKLPAAGTCGDESILLVEDDEGLCKSLARTLRARGYTVISAQTGSDALRAIRDEARGVDLVLSDVVLPDANGIALVDTIRATRPGIKTMLMSGHTDHALLEQHPLRVSAGFLQKPFASGELSMHVRKLLDADA
jgi:CheY-like chemotaxis protein